LENVPYVGWDVHTETENLQL